MCRSLIYTIIFGIALFPSLCFAAAPELPANAPKIAFEIDFKKMITETGKKIAKEMTFAQGLAMAAFGVLFVWSAIQDVNNPNASSKGNKKGKQNEYQERNFYSFDTIKKKRKKGLMGFFSAREYDPTELKYASMYDHRRNWMFENGYSLDDWKYSDVRNEYRSHCDDSEVPW